MAFTIMVILSTWSIETDLGDLILKDKIHKMQEKSFAHLSYHGYTILALENMPKIIPYGLWLCSPS